VDIACEYNSEQEINAFAFRTHAHDLGKFKIVSYSFPNLVPRIWLARLLVSIHLLINQKMMKMVSLIDLHIDMTVDIAF
jgi:hypothetical protein